MATWQRIGVAIFFTMALAVGGLLYNEVFLQTLLPVVDMDGQFSQPVGLLEVIIPIVLTVLLAAVWLWVIVGAVQDERSVNRRRVRR
jgi:hypothetical protein